MRKGRKENVQFLPVYSITFTALAAEIINMQR